MAVKYRRAESRRSANGQPTFDRDSPMLSDSAAGVASERGRSTPALRGGVVRTSLVFRAPRELDSFLRRSRRSSSGGGGHGPAAPSPGAGARPRALAGTFVGPTRREADDDLYEEVQLATAVNRGSSATKGPAAASPPLSPPASRSQSLEDLRETVGSAGLVDKMKNLFERRSQSVARVERRQHDRRHDRDRGHRHRRRRHGCRRRRAGEDGGGADPSASGDSSSLASYSDAYGACSTRDENPCSGGVAGVDSPLEEGSLRSLRYLECERTDSPARWNPEPECGFASSAREASPDELLHFGSHVPVSSGLNGWKGNRRSPLPDDGSPRGTSPDDRSRRRGRSLRRREERRGLPAGYSSKTFETTTRASPNELQFASHVPVSSGLNGSKGNRRSPLPDDGSPRGTSPDDRSRRRGRSSRRREERRGLPAGYSSKTFETTTRQASPDELPQFRSQNPVSSGMNGSKGNRRSPLRVDGSPGSTSPDDRYRRRGQSVRRREERHSLTAGYPSKTFDIATQTPSEERVRFNRTTCASSPRKVCPCATLHHGESEDDIVPARSSRRLAETRIPVCRSSTQSPRHLLKVFPHEHRRFRPHSAVSRVRGCLSATSSDSESDDNARWAHRSPSIRRGLATRIDGHTHGGHCIRKLESAFKARASSLERLTARLKLRDKANQDCRAFYKRNRNEESDTCCRSLWERYKQTHQQERHNHRWR